MWWKGGPEWVLCQNVPSKKSAEGQETLLGPGEESRVRERGTEKDRERERERQEDAVQGHIGKRGRGKIGERKRIEKEESFLICEPRGNANI